MALSLVCAGCQDGIWQTGRLIKSILEAEVKAGRVQGRAWPPLVHARPSSHGELGVADRRGTGISFMGCTLVTS